MSRSKKGSRVPGRPGDGYHLYIRERVMADKGLSMTPVQLAKEHRISLATVYRWIEREENGKLEKDDKRGGAPRKMDALNDERLRILTVVKPTISRTEARLALTEYNMNVSPSTTSRSWKRQDFTIKKVRVYARNRDENRRCLFFLNGPDAGNGERGIAGIKGIPTILLADADEAGVERSMVQRTHAHAPKGKRAVVTGLV